METGWPREGANGSRSRPGRAGSDQPPREIDELERIGRIVGCPVLRAFDRPVAAFLGRLRQRSFRVLLESSRKIDWVCRYGGEEFAIILPKASRRDACVIAERVRANVEKHKFSHETDHPVQHLTVSIGVASFPDDGNTKADLIKAADQALYEAKRLGKNRIVTTAPHR